MIRNCHTPSNSHRRSRSLFDFIAESFFEVIFLIFLSMDFSEKSVIFLKNLSMGKSRKSHQKMFLGWNQKRSGFSNHLGHLASSGRFLRTRVTPKSQFAEFADSADWIRRIGGSGGLNPPNRRIEKLLRNRINFDFQNFKSRIYRDLLYVHGTLAWIFQRIAPTLSAR